MKRLYLILVALLFLSGCDIVDQLPDDNPILKDGIEDLLDDDTDDDDPNDGKTDEEIIMENVNLVFTKMDEENAYTVQSEAKVSLLFAANNQTVSSSRIKTSIEMEREEQYYYEKMEGQFIYPQNERENIFVARMFDGRSGTIREYAFDENYVDIIQQVDNQSFDELMAIEATPYDIEFDVNDFISLERQEDDEQYYQETGHRDNNYDVTMLLSDFGNDDLSTILTELGVSDIENQTIDMFLNVNEWYILYRFTYETTITIEGTEFILQIEAESRFHYTDYIYEKISVFEEPYVVTLPETKDDILFTSSNDVMPWHGLKANQDGWTKQYVEPGIYSMYINTFASGVDYTIYDEENNIITFEQRMIMNTPTTFYVKMNSPVDTQASVVFEKKEIDDIVIDNTHLLTGGTITGYHEGEEDLNLYYLQGTSETGGFLRIDVSSVNSHVYRDDLMLMTTTVCPEDEPDCQRYADFCTITEEELCIAYISPNTNYVFEVTGEDIGGYTFPYTFYEAITYPSNLEDMYHIDDFDSDYLFYMTQNQSIYLAFEVLIYDQYDFRIDDFDPYYQRVDVEVYDENGILQETNWSDDYELGRGTYYVKLSTNQNNVVFNFELIQD